MKTLSALQVKNKIAQNPKTKLVMTLGPHAYAKCHIPGSLKIWNIESAKMQFERNVEIIVYCSDRTCLASIYAYQQLEQAGYSRIWRFSGGLVEWNKAGYPLVES